ncbi:MAG: hypothetical protein DRJ07_02770 [Bacteroidetes bacterium]|nr:MAG: hypothetical protein DRJ07_02770 [Bacteroidota bacterium]
MKKITIALALFLAIGMVFTSCENTKKGAEKDVKEISTEIEKDAKKVAKEVEKGAEEVGEAIDEGIEKTKDALAMNDYQCPMKCEGDKVYHEEGKCPKCKMDLKKVDSEHKH